MDILTLDFESYYSTEYSLRKMSPVEYILDPRFECTGLAVKRGGGKSFWIEGDKVQEFFDNQSEDVMSVSHNALFDACIAAWRYGWIPRVMLCTLGVSRAVLAAKLKALGLDSVATYLKLGKKTGALANVKNMRLNEIRAHPRLYADFIDYGLNDADLCYGIFEELVASGKFPAIEIAVMDAVLRCAVVPQFKVDMDVLHQSLGIIKAAKDVTLAQAMMLGADGKETLMSNDRFAELLLAHGVAAPTKISVKTGKTAFAFSKQDKDFLELLEHPDPNVQALVSARLGHKSTIEESRHERFINIGNLHWPKTKRSEGGYLRWLPMPLRYGGAHTHRLSGDWSMNVQNMGRKSLLRQSLVAPEGHVVVAGDESQVEARFVCTLCGQEDMRKQFENKEDVYSLFAEDIFKRPINKKTDVIERFIGKQSILGLGFGLGDNKFTANIPILAWNQMGIKLPYTPQEGKLAVDTYRGKNTNIVATWKLLNTHGINALFTGNEWRWGPVIFRKEEIILPNGTSLFYHNLRQQPGGMYGQEWVFDYGRETKRLYGGKLLENIVQALARIITMEAAVRCRMKLAKLKIPLALQVHDELVFVVLKEYEKVTRMVLEHELKTRPWWLPNLPLDCELGSGPNYGEAK